MYEEKDQHENQRTDTQSYLSYVGSAYGYVSSFFTPPLPDCQEATKLRGTLAQYKHQATWLIREMLRLDNSTQVYRLYLGQLDEFVTENDIFMTIRTLQTYINLVEDLYVRGAFFSAEEKASVDQRKEVLEEYLSRHGVDADRDDPSSIKLLDIIEKIQNSRVFRISPPRDICIAIFDYVMYSDLLRLKQHYRFVEWEISETELAKLHAAEDFLRANLFKINAFELKFETHFTLIGLRSRVSQEIQKIEKKIQDLRFEFDNTRLSISEIQSEIKEENELQAKLVERQRILHQMREGEEHSHDDTPLLETWAPRFS